MNEYYLAYDDGNMIIRSLDDGDLRKFDPKTRTWVEDNRLGRIYFGGMPVKTLTEEEVMKLTGGIL